MVEIGTNRQTFPEISDSNGATDNKENVFLIVIKMMIF